MIVNQNVIQIRSYTHNLCETFPSYYELHLWINLLIFSQLTVEINFWTLILVILNSYQEHQQQLGTVLPVL